MKQILITSGLENIIVLLSFYCVRSVCFFDEKSAVQEASAHKN